VTARWNVVFACVEYCLSKKFFSCGDVRREVGSAEDMFGFEGEFVPVSFGKVREGDFGGFGIVVVTLHGDVYW